MKPAIVFILILFVLSCNSGINYPEGGYEYVKDYKDEDTNFYFLPVRDSFSRQDSFLGAWESEYIYYCIDEPNLSISPQKEDIFRLTYSEALGGSTIIILKKNSIIIKEPIPNNYTLNYELLNEKERKFLELLDRNYPLNDDKHSGNRKRRLDSLTLLFPELLNPTYYYLLKEKALVANNTKSKYLIKTNLITKEQYRATVASINKSGYWKLPVHIPCKDQLMDGFGYILEANTKTKYNMVISGCCQNQETLPFAKACQELIKLAGLGDEISLYWDGKIDPTDSAVIIQDIDIRPIEYDVKKRKMNKLLINP